MIGAAPLIMTALSQCGYPLSSRPRRCIAQADERARALLGDLLTERESQQLAEFGYLVVRSPSVLSRVYRIPAGSGMVAVYESGKLMIEGDEARYRRRANVMRQTSGVRRWL